MLKKVLRPRIELGTYRVLGGRHNQLDHRSPLDRPLGPQASGTGYRTYQRAGTGPVAKRDCLRRGSNSCILRILELKSSALDHSATEAPAPSEIRTRVQCLGSIDDNPYTNGAPANILRLSSLTASVFPRRTLLGWGETASTSGHPRSRVPRSVRSGIARLGGPCGRAWASNPVSAAQKCPRSPRLVPIDASPGPQALQLRNLGGPKSATSWDRSRDLQIFSLTLSQLS